MNITCFILGILIIATSFLFFIEKTHSYIKSYAHMTDEDISKIKIKPLFKNIGIAIGLAGVGFLIAGIVPVFFNKIFIWYMIAWFVGAGIDAVFISKSKVYKINA